MKRFYQYLLLIVFLPLVHYGQGTPAEVMFDPDESGYPEGYTPAAKLGTFDLSSSAANEPFRHLYKVFTTT